MATKTTARELFALARMVEKYDGEFTDFYGPCEKFLPEIDAYNVDWERNERVLLRPIGEKNYDGRRYWRLGAMFFDDTPVMLTQNAGSEGNDHERRYVVDTEAYRNVVGYLMSLCEPEHNDNTHRDIGMDEERTDLTEFYGDTLEHVLRHPEWGHCC